MVRGKNLDQKLMTTEEMRDWVLANCGDYKYTKEALIDHKYPHPDDIWTLRPVAGETDVFEYGWTVLEGITKNISEDPVGLTRALQLLEFDAQSFELVKPYYASISVPEILPDMSKFLAWCETG